MALTDLSGRPLAECFAARGLTLVEATLAASFLGEGPERLIGDRAYDSDPLDATLQEWGMETTMRRTVGSRNPRLRTDASSQVPQEEL